MKKNDIIHYIVTFLAFIIIDLVWISLVILPMYQSALGDLLRPQTVLWSAFLAWLLLPLGIVVFVLPLGQTTRRVIGYGALYGLIVYGVYDLTNYAILAPYTLTMTLVDIAWGTILCALSSYISWHLKKLVSRILPQE